MANIGRQKPLELMTSHLTKAEIEERKNSELQTEKLKKVPKVPNYLSESQKKIFKKVCKQLIEVQLLTILDVDTVARYSVALDLYTQITEKINNNPELLLDNKVMNTQVKLYKQCNELSNLLCLNIISRNKVVVNNIEKEENKFLKFVKNNRDDANE